MCYSETTSAITFSISLLCFIYLIYKGYTTRNNFCIISGSITILIGLMQLIEFFIWRNQECNNINHFFSLSIIFVLYLQGIITSIVYYLLYPSKKIFYIEIIYTIFTIYLLYWLNNLVLCSKPTKESCRLEWAPFEQLINTSMYSRLLMIIFLFFYFLLSGIIGIKLFLLYFNKYPISILILPITFIFTILYAFLVEGKNYIDIFGSMWCFLAVVYGLIACLYVY